MQFIINPCHALRHNVKFSFSSMTLQLISGRGSMSHAQRLCVCASTQFKLNRPRLARCHSENRCRRRAINLNLMLNMLKRCKQFVDWAENERSHIYISFACKRLCNALSLVGAFVQWVCKMEGTSRDVWGFRAVLILAEMLISVLSYLQIHWVFNFISVV